MANTIDMEKGLKRVINLYYVRSIHVNQVNMDNDFEYINNTKLPATLELVAAE